MTFTKNTPNVIMKRPVLVVISYDLEPYGVQSMNSLENSERK